MAWRKYSEFTESTDNVRQALVDAYDNFEILRAMADMQGKGALLLNGDCAIDQPNAGASVAATGGVYGRDGLRIAKSGSGGFTTQKTTNANLLTTRNPVITCDRYTVTTAAAAPGAGDFYIGNMRVEGLRASRLQYGRASARKAWLCATARSSIDMTLSGALQNSAQDRSYPWSVALVANTTKDIAVEIPGCTDGTWLVDNGIGLFVMLALGVGSTYGGTANAWASANKYGVAGAGLMATLGATLDITAWELVVGDVAPAFYMPPDPALELLRCQREYWKTFAQGTAPAQNVGIDTGEFNFPALGSSATSAAWLKHPVAMRATPSLTTYNPAAASTQVRDRGTSANCSSTTVLNAGQNGAFISCIADAGASVGNTLAVHVTCDGRL